jgi:hypothetical protein
LNLESEIGHSNIQAETGQGQPIVAKKRHQRESMGGRTPCGVAPAVSALRRIT